MRALLLAGLVAGTVWGQTEIVQAQAPSPPPRFEVTLLPVRVQVNGLFTQHLGSFGVASWSPREHLALQLLGGGNWYNEESAFNGELVEKFRVEAQSASSVLWTWGLFGAVELEPFLGEFTLFQAARARLGFVVSVGAGAGGTRHRLWPASDTPAAYGDTGVHFMATVAAGLRFRIGEHFVARFEVRDVGYSAAINTINGCTGGDLAAINRRLEAGRDLGGAEVSSACRGFVSPNEARAGLWLTRNSSSDIIHNLGLALGAGFTF